MIDPAHEETEKLLKEIENRITKEFRQAEKEIQEKLDDYMKRFQTKDKIWQKWVKDGVKTQKQYDEWRVGQIAIGKRWEEMRDTIAQDCNNANKIARSIVYEHMPEVYAINHNYATYEAEKGALVDTSYTLYDRQTVERLFNGDEKFYHDPGRKIAEAIRNNKDIAWNKSQIQSVMLQSLLQGESIPDIATRLADTVTEKNRKAAIRNARTMTTGVQNAGRVQGFKRAENMGIDLMQTWVATLDGRTRHSHRRLDGETVAVGDVFSNGCEYPGDPNGAPEETYNCRCTLIGQIKGFERNVRGFSLRDDPDVGGMSYEEWKEDRNEKYNPIDLPEKKQAAIKNNYLQKYMRKIRK